MPTQVVSTFPHRDKLKSLVRQHRKITGEPLVLAVCYVPKRNPGDVFIFEIARNFGEDSIDPERRMFEVTYGSTPGFPMKAGHRLHLTLTNPDEVKVAVRERWDAIRELQEAFREDKAEILFATQTGKALWDLICD